MSWGAAGATEPSGIEGRGTDACPVLAELRSIAVERRRLDAREAELLAEASATATAEVHTGHTLPGWWAETNQQPVSVARSRVRLAVRLDEHPLQPLRRALAEGRVGWAHVAAFDRAANPRVRAALCELLPELLDLADVATFERWCQELRGIAERLDADGGYDPSADPANNRLHLTPLVDGVTHVSGTLVGEVALLVRALIDAATDEVAARYRRDAEAVGGPLADLPPRSQMAAEAMLDLLQAGAAVPTPERSVLHPDVIAVHDARDDRLTDRDGSALPLHVLRFILAAALIHPLEVTGSGDPLRMGRAIRYANRHQRRALVVRDGGCIFPGCNAPAHHCDAHHVDEWDDGGPTDIENLALLCRHHHRVTHRPGWVMARWIDPDEPDVVQFRWTLPSGRVVYSQRHHIRRPAPVA